MLADNALFASWWITLAVTVAIALLVPFVAFTKQKNVLDQATAVLLLPVVPALVKTQSSDLFFG